MKQNCSVSISDDTELFCFVSSAIAQRLCDPVFPMLGSGAYASVMVVVAYIFVTALHWRAILEYRTVLFSLPIRTVRAKGGTS